MITRLPSALFTLEDLVELGDKMALTIKNELEEHSLYTQFERDLAHTRSLMVKQNWGIDAENTDLRIADQNRDDAFIAFRDGTRACTLRLNTTIRDTAKLVYAIILKAGYRLHNYSDREQSEAMQSLFKAYSSSENRKALERIGQWDAFQEMKEAQETFDHMIASLESVNSTEDVHAYRGVKRVFRKQMKEMMHDLEGIASQRTQKKVNEIIKRAISKKK